MKSAKQVVNIMSFIVLVSFSNTLVNNISNKNEKHKKPSPLEQISPLDEEIIDVENLIIDEII